MRMALKALDQDGGEAVLTHRHEYVPVPCSTRLCPGHEVVSFPQITCDKSGRDGRGLGVGTTLEESLDVGKSEVCRVNLFTDMGQRRTQRGTSCGAWKQVPPSFIELDTFLMGSSEGRIRDG